MELCEWTILFVLLEVLEKTGASVYECFWVPTLEYSIFTSFSPCGTILVGLLQDMCDVDSPVFLPHPGT